MIGDGERRKVTLMPLGGKGQKQIGRRREAITLYVFKRKKPNFKRFLPAVYENQLI